MTKPAPQPELTLLEQIKLWADLDLGFEFYKTDLEAVIMMGSGIIPQVPYVFDLSALSHSREQGWLLALMAADHLRHSPLFRCKRVGLICPHKETIMGACESWSAL
jgi:hypothetical protein